jgi:S-adenosylmethionine:tRNA ribosyltransferase-isomerase
MLTSDFDFDLPPNLIAQQAAPRGASRLLVLDAAGDGRHRHVADLPRLLRHGDLLIVNNTRVIPARLFARRATGRSVELLLVERQEETTWDVLAKPGRAARVGARLWLDGDIEAEVLATSVDGRRRVRFSEPLEPHLERVGHVPLPPYIKRQDDETDRGRYQTVFATEPGAIAAPTAGLHFTTELLAELAAAGIATHALTLHVGIGTFKPVTAKLVHEHQMESERYDIPTATAQAIAAARARGGRIVAVGTTVVRTLETAARLASGRVLPGRGTTDLFITPGFPFQVVDTLLTNFHLPCSTLLMLVSAFAGTVRLRAAYAEAIAHAYRFYSYGDAMLVDRS